jgi:hypothetical protein
MFWISEHALGSSRNDPASDFQWKCLMKTLSLTDTQNTLNTKWGGGGGEYGIRIYYTLLQILIF